METNPIQCQIRPGTMLWELFSESSVLEIYWEVKQGVSIINQKMNLFREINRSYTVQQAVVCFCQTLPAKNIQQAINCVTPGFPVWFFALLKQLLIRYSNTNFWCGSRGMGDPPPDFFANSAHHPAER